MGDAMERIQLGSTVIIYNGNAKELLPLVMRRGGEIQNQMGYFRHEDMIGKPFGSMVRALAVTERAVSAHSCRKCGWRPCVLARPHASPPRTD